MSQLDPRSIEVSARTVEDAVGKALQQLGCTRAEVEIEVLHPGSPGRLLGFGAEPARVRVTRLATAEPGAMAATERTTGGVRVPAYPEADETDETDETDEADETAGYSAVAGMVGARAALQEEEEGEEDEEEAPPAGNAADEAELARLMLAELLNHMGMRGLRVEITSVEPMMLDIRGGDVADLIGRRGENLRALQFVLSLMMNKQLRRHVRITVDADGYRARREALLHGMAQRLAHRVRSTRQALQLEAMPPNERRIVHLALAEDPEVTTESVGEGDARRVIIKPRL